MSERNLRNINSLRERRSKLIWISDRNGHCCSSGFQNSAYFKNLANLGVREHGNLKTPGCRIEQAIVDKAEECLANGHPCAVEILGNFVV